MYKCLLGSINNGTSFFLVVLSDMAKSNTHILTIKTHEISSEHNKTPFKCFKIFLYLLIIYFYKLLLILFFFLIERVVKHWTNLSRKTEE